jgi:hypothetical protein
VPPDDLPAQRAPVTRRHPHDRVRPSLSREPSTWDVAPQSQRHSQTAFLLVLATRRMATSRPKRWPVRSMQGLVMGHRLRIPASPGECGDRGVV